MSEIYGVRAHQARRDARIASEVLPTSVYRKHGRLYYCYQDAATKAVVWHPLEKTWGESKREWERLVRLNRSPAYVKKHLYTDEDGGIIPTKFLKEMLTNARKNAKARGMVCELSIDNLKALACQSGGKCALTGIAFEYGPAAELRDAPVRRKRVWAPSLDRIVGTQGYTIDNLRIVCMAVNIGRQEFGDEVLFKVARGLSNIQCFDKNQRPSVKAKSTTYEDPSDGSNLTASKEQSLFHAGLRGVA